jgi:hypothetical protein
VALVHVGSNPTSHPKLWARGVIASIELLQSSGAGWNPAVSTKFCGRLTLMVSVLA